MLRQKNDYKQTAEYSDKKAATLAKREQALRDGTLEVTNRKLINNKTTCWVLMKDVATGKEAANTHSITEYGCTEDECLWLKSVMEGN